MRYFYFILFWLTLSFISCKKTNPNFIIPNGAYSGTFQRLTNAGGQISNVTITFSDNNWTGQSQFAKYPALCHGTYRGKGADSLIFENACPWTAEFDWSLILSGSYKIVVSDKNLQINRSYNGVYSDIYNLTRQ